MSTIPDYRGWRITWDYGRFAGTHSDFEASYEGPEDGWVGNGMSAEARTLESLHAEIDTWIVENCQHCDGNGKVWNNADPTSGQWLPCAECLLVEQSA